MKVSNKVLYILLACFLGIVCIFATSQLGYAMQVGFLVGDVYVTRGGATNAASMGLQLQKDDIVKTVKGGMAELNFKDGSVLTVQESSKIRIVTVHGGEQDSFSVLTGIVKARFSKLKKGSHRKIYTPTTVCGIRGTEFEIAVSDSVDSKVHMKEGVVELQNQYGTSTVKGNDQAKIPVAGKPEITEDDSTIDKWKENKDKDFSENPSASAERLTRHLDVMKERADNNSESISEMKNTLPDEVTIKDFDVLFNPKYQVDLIKIMITACKKKPFSIIWPGKCVDGKLFYAEEGYSDYKVFNVESYDVTCIV